MAEVASKPTEPVPLDTIPISPEGGEKEEAATNGSNGKVVTEIPVTRGQVRAVVRVYISPNTDVFALRSC